MAESFRSPDSRLLRDEALPEASFPASRREDFRVYFDADAHDAIRRHVREDLSVEVGGVLVGQWRRDADGPFVVVSRSIRCDSSDPRAAEMTFTHDAWAKIHQEMDTLDPELRIVGWYHSHPNFGIFLSERDRFIQEHFFSNPGQIAHVVDPVRNTEGVFAWRDGKPELADHFWIGDALAVTGDDAPVERPSDAVGPSHAPGPVGASENSNIGGVRALQMAALCVLVFLLGYLMAMGMNSLDRRRLAEGAVAHYGIWKGLRPGLEDHLLVVERELKEISDATEKLLTRRDAPVEPDGDPKKREAELKAETNRLLRRLATTRLVLGQIRDVYGLTPEEAMVVSRLIAIKTAEVGSPKPKEGPRKPNVATPVKPADQGGRREKPKNDAAGPAAAKE